MGVEGGHGTAHVEIERDTEGERERYLVRVRRKDDRSGVFKESFSPSTRPSLQQS